MDPEFAYEIFNHREEGYMRIVATGSINFEMLKQMYASVLTNPQYESGMSRLWDFTQLDVSPLTSDHLNAFAQFKKKENLGIDTAYSAILVNRDLEFGMVRMLQALGDGLLSPNVLVTRSHDEALTWISAERG